MTLCAYINARRARRSGRSGRRAPARASRARIRTTRPPPPRRRSDGRGGSRRRNADRPSSALAARVRGARGKHRDSRTAPARGSARARRQSQRSPRSGRSFPATSGRTSTRPSACSRRGVLRSPHNTRGTSPGRARCSCTASCVRTFASSGLGLIGECRLTSSSAGAVSRTASARSGQGAAGNLERGDRGPRRSQDGERPAPGSGRLERGVRDVPITGLGERGRPRRERARAHLLQADHVGLRAGDAGRLLRLAPHPSRNVPAHQSQGRLWGRKDSRPFCRLSRRFYSPLPLAARALPRYREAIQRAPARRASESSRRPWASGSFCSFLSVLFSIWRMRSRVTPKASADLLERERLLAGQPVAHLDHLALALRQHVERPPDVLALHDHGRRLERRLRRLVLDEVAERGVLVLADRLLERDRRWAIRRTSRTSRGVQRAPPRSPRRSARGRASARAGARRARRC